MSTDGEREAVVGADRFGHRPALDGVRAVAVVAVVLFHARVPGFGGGFLGVSVFFTLSGFLITSLLIHEHERSGCVALGGFFARRLRRLAPASLLCIVVVLAAGQWWSAVQRDHLDVDVWSALGNVANWRFAFQQRTYAELFRNDPSPLAHFWSLAIEEQAYVVLPLVAAWALRRGARRLGAVLVGLIAVSLAATLLTGDADLAYHGTHTRGAELLVGALAAVLAHRRAIWVGWSSVAAALGLVVLAVATPMSRVDQRWLTAGGFVALSVVWAAMVVGLSRPNVITRALSWRPLVALGARSYGVYLFHWPLLLLVPWRPVALAATAVLVEVSYRWVERPVRERRLFHGQRTALVGWGVALAFTAVAAAVVVPAPAYTREEALLALGDGSAVHLSAPTTEPAAEPARRVRIEGSNHSIIPALVAQGWQVVPSDDAGPVDLVVVAVGASDNVPVKGLDVAGVATALAESADEWRERLGAVLATGARVVLFDAALEGSPGGGTAARAALLLGIPAHTSMQEVLKETATMLSPAAAEPRRALVLGDSTSLVFAQALSDTASGALDVLWAGANDCPIARVDASRAASGWDWKPNECEQFDSVVPPVLDRFSPDLVVIVAGPIELQEQQIGGDPTPRAAGDPVFDAFHTSEFDELVRLIGPSTPVFVTDCPPLQPGVWSTAEMADPVRLASWNRWLRGWAASRPDQVHLLDLADAVVGYETVHGDMRIDGVHPALEPLAGLIRDRWLQAFLNPDL